jgi:hypothetical protein
MGSSVVPAPSATSDKWEQISSVTASGSTVSFTSISGYRKLKVIAKPTTTSTLATINVRFNSDSGSNYSYAYQRSSGGAASFLDVKSRATEVSFGALGNSFGGSLTIENVNTTGVKTFQGYSLGTGSGTNYTDEISQGDYETTSAITSLQLITGSTFTGGNITLYGVAL